MNPTCRCGTMIARDVRPGAYSQSKLPLAGTWKGATGAVCMRKPVYLLLAAVLLAELDAASACSMRNLANDEDLFCKGINRVVRTSISAG